MSYGRNKSIRSDHHIIADENLSYIQNRQIIVTCEIVPDMDIFSVITVKYLCYPNLLSNASKIVFRNYSEPPHKDLIGLT